MVMTYFLLLEFEQCDSVCEQLDIVLGAFLRRSLAGKSIADLHAVSIYGHLVAVVLLSIVHHLLLLLLINVVLVHLFVVQFLLLRAPFAHLLSSCTLRSHLLLLHHL